MCCQGALDSIKSKNSKDVVNFDGCMEKLFDTLSTVCVTPPKFRPENIIGVPIYALFIDFLNTPFGEAFFANPIVNSHLKNVFEAYQNMLLSKESLKYLNEEPEGWFSPEALYNSKTHAGFWKPEDYVLDRKDKPNWGFTSWNDWFIRRVKS